jgi:hypothetical protein
MPDFDFNVVRVPKASRHVAARYVLLEGLTQRRIARLPDKSYAAHLVGKVRATWRNLLNRLRRAKWEKATDPLSLQYLRNCPPVGVVTDRLSRICSERLLCPFCYAREALKTFRKVEAALFDGKYLKKECWAVEFKSTVSQKRINALVQSQGAADERMHAIHVVLDKVCEVVQNEKERNAERRAVPQAFGGFVMHRVPYRAGGYPTLSRSGVLFVPKNTQPDFGSHAKSSGFKYRLHEKVTKGMLTRAFARVFRLDPGWLRSADPEEVKAYLNAFERVRMMAAFGALRKAVEPQPKVWGHHDDDGDQEE